MIELKLRFAQWVLRRIFGDVKQVSPAELARWLAVDAPERPVLLDARDAAEFSISHLAGAIRIDPAAGEAELRELKLSDRPVVVYCAVGYRSAKVARRLQTLGQGRVFNLDGAIFAWSSERLPMVNSAGATTRVHPFNGFGRWLLPPHCRD
ncbi:MAG: rhodanese-like domain-containing protein [Pedosphaera sp.]|nr:rhodanese-like domain-containing protein [Pedosphaera sp.]